LDKPIAPDVRAALVKWYGPDKGNSAQHAEAFEVCEYGAQPDEARLKQIFPMLGHGGFDSPPQVWRPAPQRHEI
jgi:hypothetical protein